MLDAVLSMRPKATTPDTMALPRKTQAALQFAGEVMRRATLCQALAQKSESSFALAACCVVALKISAVVQSSRTPTYDVSASIAHEITNALGSLSRINSSSTRSVSRANPIA